jgi:hypothetical protein
MALNASDWIQIDPRHDRAVRELIKEKTDSIVKLADTLSGDELMALIVKVDMFLELRASSQQLAWSANSIRDRRLRDAPEPAGVDWACESGDRAADVVSACRLIDKRRTGRLWWAWPGRLLAIGDVLINQYTLRRWRQGDEPVDRAVVIAALKVAMVEDARELRL